MWSSIVDMIKNEYNSIRVWHQPDTHSVDTNQATAIGQDSDDIDKRKNNAPLTSPCLGVHKAHNLRISRRTSFQEHHVNLYGWPSRGGVIVLEHATPPDFGFLNLDHLDPPLRRDPDPKAEDKFCQKLLHLGATWWDSEERRRFVSRLEHGHEDSLDAVHAGERLAPTLRERGWVRVAWPTDPAGALCVLACEKIIMGRTGKEKLRPSGYTIGGLARTMDERCAVLQRLGGVMYASIEEYSGLTFLKAWEENHTGEEGPLEHEEFIDPHKYGGHPDDALNTFVSSEEFV
jgi:hypothetical protein